jgi:DNA-binding PadR family transcriptional regulator
MVMELGPDVFRPRLSPIQLLLLVQLENSPKYGYDMLKTIRDELSDVWIPKTGTIYPALKSLEKHKLIEKHDKGGIDFYYITDEGRERLLRIPIHQKQNFRFAVKYLTSIVKWASPNLKNITLASMTNFDNEEVNFLEIMINLLSEDVDNNIKLKILRKMSINLEKQQKKVNEMILGLEGISE